MIISRIKKRKDFIQAAQSLSVARASLVIQMCPTNLFSCSPPNKAGTEKTNKPEQHIRSGFTASKRVGNAVQRNRAKRRLKEAARQLLPLYGMIGYDYVFIARKTTPDYRWSKLLNDMEKVLLKLSSRRHLSKT